MYLQGKKIVAGTKNKTFCPKMLTYVTW